jgi:propanol-preferring alcohol dehydrogenase
VYLQQLSYHQHLWQEREIKSVANITGKDISDFLELAAKASIRPTVQQYPLEAANIALLELKEQKIRGSKVLKIYG